MIANCLGNSGLGDFFGQRISVDEVRVFKPSPVVYRHAAGLLSRPVEQIRLVTSNAFDSVGASTAGMRRVNAARPAGVDGHSDAGRALPGRARVKFTGKTSGGDDAFV
jgi:2-haloacid dehalogenase